MKKVYLDYVATTPVRREVVGAMNKYWTKAFGNPGSITAFGVEAAQAVAKSRETIATHLNCRPAEIYFTSGGTESNNLAILGVFKTLKRLGYKASDLHAITTSIEHSSVLAVFQELEREGVKVDYLVPDRSGHVDDQSLRKLFRQNTFLVSIGYVNNELGTIQNLKYLAKEVRHARTVNTLKTKDDQSLSYPYFHTDASQAGLYLDLNLAALGPDLLTLDAQKIYGPKGVGLLYVRSGASVQPIIYGGGQEQGLRSGTEPVPLVVGLATAFDLARKNWEKKKVEALKLKTILVAALKKNISTVELNSGEVSLPNLVNIFIPTLDAEYAVLQLDQAGFVVSTKSACATEESVSPVLSQLVGEERALSSLRISFGIETKASDLGAFVKALKLVVDKQSKY